MSTMQLSKNTIDTLKKTYEVNQSVKFVKDADLLKVKSVDNTLLVHAPIDQSFPRDFHIYDVREFLSVLSIIEEPELDFSNDNYVVITSKDNKQKIRYLESDPTFVESSYVDKTPKNPDPEVNLSVSEQDFQSVMKAANIMNLEFVGFVCDGENIYLTAFNKHTGGDDNETNTFTVHLSDYDHDTEFKLFYRIDSQNVSVLLGEGDLDFELSSKKISKIKTGSDKTYWIAMNIDSNYG